MPINTAISFRTENNYTVVKVAVTNGGFLPRANVQVTTSWAPASRLNLLQVLTPYNGGVEGVGEYQWNPVQIGVEQPVPFELAMCRTGLYPMPTVHAYAIDLDTGDNDSDDKTVPNSFRICSPGTAAGGKPRKARQHKAKSKKKSKKKSRRKA